MNYDDYFADHSHIRRMFGFLDLPFDEAAVEAVFAKPLTHAKRAETGMGCGGHADDADREKPSVADSLKKAQP